MQQRQDKILSILRQEGRVRISDLAARLDVTEMTIRRDLRFLEKEEQVLQVKGGAVPFPVRYQPDTGTFIVTERKIAIARALYRAIMPLETVFISTGSTALAFAVLLSRINRFSVTVITNSLPVASALFRSCCKVILTGGELRSRSLDLVGPAAERSLQEYHVQWLITGCDGAFAERGFYTSDLSLSNLERKSVAIADHTAVLSESGKFGRKALTCFASVPEVDILATDSGLKREYAARLEKAGVRIVYPRKNEKTDDFS